MESALQHGETLLRDGKTSKEVAVAVTCLLEDSELTNAGKIFPTNFYSLQKERVLI